MKILKDIQENQDAYGILFLGIATIIFMIFKAITE